MAKTPARTKKHIAAPVGGVLFAAIMFIIFSMMVITLSRRPQSIFIPANTESSETANYQQQITLLQQQLAQARQSESSLQVCTSQLDNMSAKVSGYSKLLSVMDLDERLLGALMLNASEAGIPTSTQPQILLRRTSPSGQKTAVIYGEKQPGRIIAHGFFIRTGNTYTAL